MPDKTDKPGLFEKLKNSLVRTRDSIKSRVEDLVRYYKEIDDEFFNDLEDILVSADAGALLSHELVEGIKKRVRQEKIGDPSRIKGLLKDAIAEKLSAAPKVEFSKPAVILMVGVNGTGKTTTAAKLANLYKSQGLSVMMAAADTFRAAAIEQLKVWGDRMAVPVLAQQQGSDPAAVVFDAIQAAKARKCDVLICDTAGRLHNKKNLMIELEKVQRIVKREFPEAHHESFLVLDATTGQNAIEQTKLFSEVAEITGLVLTKLDGTAKGGIVIGISSNMKVPVRYICTGESIEEIQDFDSQRFADAMFD
jgi:fused signal recognition particle receptor